MIERFYNSANELRRKQQDSALGRADVAVAASHEVEMGFVMDLGHDDENSDKVGATQHTGITQVQNPYGWVNRNQRHEVELHL